jgi:ABC-type multidrug transport system fused ATPase/permease subunit
MIQDLKERFLDSSVIRSARILDGQDRRKLIWIMVIQTGLGFLDLIGVVLIGGIGALSVQGIESRGSGNKVGLLLRLFSLETEPLRVQVAVLGITAAVILILKTLASIYFTRKIYFFLAHKGAKISANLIGKILSQDLVKLEERTSQEILFITSEGVKNITVGILATCMNMVSDVSTLIVLSLGLLVIDPYIALATLLLFSVTGYFLYSKLQNRSRQIGLEINKLSVESNQKVIEVLNSYRELVVHQRRSFYSKQIGTLRYKLGSVTAEINFQPYISKYAIESITVIGILVLAGFEFASKNAVHAVATLAVFMAASSRIAPAALRIQQGLLMVRNSSGTAESTFELVTELKERDVKTDGEFEPDFTYQGFVPNIELTQVNFRYPDREEYILKNINLQIEPGSRVAIVGPSGAGKTTLVDLILGILQPESGTVSVSNRYPTEVSENWPGSISYVPQNIFISTGTIRENISLGYPQEIATDERIWKALELAGLSGVVAALPKKLDSLTGEQGSKLSGGQRQRVGIARALFTSPKLLVLDEATSSLDGQTELNISSAISNLSEDVTILMIAHRLSTVRNANQVIYIENGEIRARGTFEEVRKQIPDFDQQAKLMGI